MTFQSENSWLPHKKFGKNNHYPVVMSRLNEFWKTKSMHHDKSKNLPHANANMRSPNVSTQQYWTCLREFEVTTQATEDMNLIKYNLLDMARFSRINWVYSAKFEKVCTIFSFLWCARRGRWKRQFTIQLWIILKLATEESKFYAQIFIHTTKYHFGDKITLNTIEHAWSIHLDCTF